MRGQDTIVSHVGIRESVTLDDADSQKLRLFVLPL